ELVSQARAHGGSDNITAVVVDVTDDDGRAEQASAALADMPPADATRQASALPPEAEEAARPERPAPAPATPPPAAEARPRRLTWRVAMFLVVLVAVVGASLAAVGWYARRTAELGLVLLAAVLPAGAYVLASLGRTSSIPANIGPFLGVILVLLGAAHVATRRLAPAADGVLLPLAALLNGLGYVFIARLDHKLAGLQAIWTALGVAAYIGTLWVVRRTRDLERFRYTF